MIRIFDSQRSSKVDFEPLEDGKIGFYLCGPTVYDRAHLGHGRSAVSFDVIRRYFIYRGYDVKFVSNYTDIDDKMINRAEEEGISVVELTEKIVPEYTEDYGALGIMVPDVIPYATKHIDGMVDLIKKLEKNGYTYVLDDGVYFDVSKFEKYGEFSRQNLDELQMGSRVEVKDEKHNPQDFVLWKFKKEGEPFWESPWGDGRPGWHVECSAMSFTHLGETFDIHGGGLDLKFPHHECEVAQSHGAFGEGTFAKYWLHNGFIQVDNEKMSKSLGNFFTLKDIFKKYDPRVVRFMFLQTHYRNPINFSDKLLDQAKAGLLRLHDFVRTETKRSEVSGSNVKIKDLIEEAKRGFESSMDDDFDTSGALGRIFELLKKFNILKDRDEVDGSDSKVILEFLKSVDEVLGVIFSEEEEVDDEIDALIKEREKARSNKDFARSDEIRDDLLKKGIILEDTSDGTVWKRK